MWWTRTCRILAATGDSLLRATANRLRARYFARRRAPRPCLSLTATVNPARTDRSTHRAGSIRPGDDSDRARSSIHHLTGAPRTDSVPWAWAEVDPRLTRPCTHSSVHLRESTEQVSDA